MSGERLYRWSLLSSAGGAVRSSGGIELGTEPLASVEAAAFDMLIVCGGVGFERVRDAGLLAFLRRSARVGVRLSQHETPRINPNWNDVFAVGDVSTLEPGLYGHELRGGVRIEHDYVFIEHRLIRL